MSICEKCKKRNICKEICPKLKKKISNCGISFRQKEKTYAVDFNLLESSRHLDAFYLEVRRRIAQDSFLKEITGIDLEDLIKKHLTERERLAVQLLLDGYRQEDIAKRMKISQERVNFLLSRSVGKLKLFFTGGL